MPTPHSAEVCVLSGDGTHLPPTLTQAGRMDFRALGDAEPWAAIPQRGLAAPHCSLPLAGAVCRQSCPPVSANSITLLLRPDVSTYAGGPGLQHALRLQEGSSAGFWGSQTLLRGHAPGMEMHAAGWWVHRALQCVHATSHHPALSQTHLFSQTLPWPFCRSCFFSGAAPWEPQVAAQHLPLWLNAGTALPSLYPPHPRVKPEVG